MKRILSAVILSALAVSPFAFANDSALNSVGVYGNIYGDTSAHGTTTGGLGVRGSYFQDQYLFSANYHHDFGSPISGATGGSTTGINVKLGYLFPLSGHLAIGPYISYQYLRIAASADHGNVSARSTDNDIGGGAYAAYVTGPLTFTGNLGYLAGVSATDSATIGNQSASVSANASNLFELGLQADYQISGPWYVSTGFKYDNYGGGTGGKGTNILQGNIGLGYSF